MRDFRDAKAMAQTLREALKARSVTLTHGESLELVAKTFGFHDWNVLSARIQTSQSAGFPSATPTSAAILPPVSIGARLPVLPMRDLVVFPQMNTAIFVGREKTRRAVESAMAGDRRILIVAQKHGADDNPILDSLYPVGVASGVISLQTQADGILRLFISGLQRTAIVRPIDGEFLAAEVAPIEETRGQSAEAIALSRAVLDAYQIYAKIDFSAVPPGSRFALPSIGDPSLLADTVAQMLAIGMEKKQQLLEMSDIVMRLEAILDLMKVGQTAA